MTECNFFFILERFKMINLSIYRMTHAETGEVFEGSMHECGAHVHRNPSRISQAYRRGFKVADFWTVTRVTDEAVILSHAVRLGYERKCEICGETYLAKTTKQRTCGSKCAKVMARTQCAEWRDRNSGLVPAPAPVEKQIEMSEHARINAAARDARLSYGYYVAATEYPVKIVRKW
jgi:hypothetical protein